MQGLARGNEKERAFRSARLLLFCDRIFSVATTKTNSLKYHAKRMISMAVLVFFMDGKPARNAVLTILATLGIDQRYCIALYVQKALLVFVAELQVTTACKLSLLFLRTAFLQQILNDERTLGIACVLSAPVAVHFFLPYFEPSQECRPFES